MYSKVHSQGLNVRFVHSADGCKRAPQDGVIILFNTFLEDVWGFKFKLFECG